MFSIACQSYCNCVQDSKARCLSNTVIIVTTSVRLSGVETIVDEAGKQIYLHS